MLVETIANILTEQNLCVLSSDPHLDTLSCLSSVSNSLIRNDISVIIVTSSRSRATALRKSIIMRHAEVFTFYDLRSSCCVNASHSPSSRVLILDAYVSSPSRKLQVVLSNIMSATRSTFVSCCMQLVPTLLMLLEACPRFGLQGATTCEELMRARVALFHNTGNLRPPPIFVSASPMSAVEVVPLDKLYSPRQFPTQTVSIVCKCSDSTNKLHSIFPSLRTKLEQGKLVAILSGVPTTFLTTLATEVRVRLGYNKVIYGVARGTSHFAVQASSPGTLWILTYRQAAGKLKDIDILGYECMLLDLPSNPIMWMYLNFSPSTKAVALKVVMNNTLREQTAMHRMNVLITKELRSWQSRSRPQLCPNVLARQLQVPVAFKAEVVQALRFFILLRCLFLKHGNLACAAGRTPPVIHSSLCLLDVLQRYTHSSLLHERRLCKVTSIIKLCVAAEPLLKCWLRSQPANLPPSLYMDILGRLPPDDIQRHITSYLAEAQLDAMDMIATRYGRLLLDGSDTRSFLATVEKLPTYLQEQIICAYPAALLFAQKHLYFEVCEFRS